MRLHILFSGIRHTHRLLIAILVTVIASCTTPTQPSNDTPAQTSSSGDTLELLLERAKAAQLQSSPARETQLINIVNRLLALGEDQQASQLLEKINSDQLSSQQFPAYVIAGSYIYLQEQQLLKAKTLLEDSRLTENLTNLNIEMQRQIHRNRAQLYQQIGDVATSLNEYIVLGTLLSETTDINENNNAIWKQLNTMTSSELELLFAEASNEILRGWFGLAIASKTSQGTLEAQNQAILNWVTANPNHPASIYLPADLALLQDMIQSRPNNIALLLPLKGKLAKAGQAIRDGFLASYYLSYRDSSNTPMIQLYDTSEGDIVGLYNKAVLNGAAMIVGPLQKDKVSSLLQHPNLSVPVLALNYASDNTDNINLPLYQFGLSLEDEARQVADRAWLEGHRQAMIISSKASWGQRAANAFTERWQSYGGTIILNSQLSNSETYSDTIKGVLHIDQSKQRATELKRLFGRSFEFEPRRRNDIDMIFLVARAKEGRQIKPTLNFHYAGNIPVYATSQIYSSANNKETNIDLNNIRLTTLPWVINASIEEKRLIDENLKVSPGYERLYALGVDSFLLYPRLEQLFQLSDQQLYGATGKLSINSDKRIARQQVWAEIKNGELRPLRTLTLSTDQAL